MDIWEKMYDKAKILDALDWQIPFFEKHGYTVCGTFEDYPKGHRWYQLQKLL